MTDRPILFSAPMIRAILDGRKTQTRRVLKPTDDAFETPKFSRGDRLWVREAHYMTDDGESSYAVFAEDEDGVTEHLENMATTMSSFPQIDWSKHILIRPSIHMPRWASRLTLIVEDVRVQRLQEITLGDICNEGLATSIYDFKPATRGFNAWVELWDGLNAPRGYGWDANPWVVAITFRTIRANIDSERARDE